MITGLTVTVGVYGESRRCFPDTAGNKDLETSLLPPPRLVEVMF